MIVLSGCSNKKDSGENPVEPKYQPPLLTMMYDYIDANGNVEPRTTEVKNNIEIPAMKIKEFKATLNTKLFDTALYTIDIRMTPTIASGEQLPNTTTTPAEYGTIRIGTESKQVMIQNGQIAPVDFTTIANLQNSFVTDLSLRAKYKGRINVNIVFNNSMGRTAELTGVINVTEGLNTIVLLPTITYGAHPYDLNVALDKTKTKFVSDIRILEYCVGRGDLITDKDADGNITGHRFSLETISNNIYNYSSGNPVQIASITPYIAKVRYAGDLKIYCRMVDDVGITGEVTQNYTIENRSNPTFDLNILHGSTPFNANSTYYTPTIFDILAKDATDLDSTIHSILYQVGTVLPNNQVNVIAEKLVTNAAEFNDPYRYTFSSEGDYKIIVTVKDSHYDDVSQKGISTKNVTVKISPMAPPVAKINILAEPGRQFHAGETVSFSSDGTTASPNGTVITSYLWEIQYPDATRVTIGNTQYISDWPINYIGPGKIFLTVTDNAPNGTSGTVSVDLPSVNRAPSLIVKNQKTNTILEQGATIVAFENDTITLVAEGGDDDANVTGKDGLALDTLKYYFDFGTGYALSSTGIGSNNYTSQGQRQVKVKVTDSRGLGAEKTFTVDVTSFFADFAAHVKTDTSMTSKTAFNAMDTVVIRSLYNRSDIANYYWKVERVNSSNNPIGTLIERNGAGITSIEYPMELIGKVRVTLKLTDLQGNEYSCPSDPMAPRYLVINSRAPIVENPVAKLGSSTLQWYDQDEVKKEIYYNIPVFVSVSETVNLSVDISDPDTLVPALNDTLTYSWYTVNSTGQNVGIQNTSGLKTINYDIVTTDMAVKEYKIKVIARDAYSMRGEYLFVVRANPITSPLISLNYSNLSVYNDNQPFNLTPIIENINENLEIQSYQLQRKDPNNTNMWLNVNSPKTTGGSFTFGPRTEPGIDVSLDDYFNKTETFSIAVNFRNKMTNKTQVFRSSNNFQLTVANRTPVLALKVLDSINDVIMPVDGNDYLSINLEEEVIFDYTASNDLDGDFGSISFKLIKTDTNFVEQTGPGTEILSGALASNLPSRRYVLSNKEEYPTLAVGRYVLKTIYKDALTNVSYTHNQRIQFDTKMSYINNLTIYYNNNSNFSLHHLQPSTPYYLVFSSDPNSQGYVRFDTEKTSGGGHKIEKYNVAVFKRMGTFSKVLDFDWENETLNPVFKLDPSTLSASSLTPGDYRVEVIGYSIYGKPTAKKTTEFSINAKTSAIISNVTVTGSSNPIVCGSKVTIKANILTGYNETIDNVNLIINNTTTSLGAVPGTYKLTYTSGANATWNVNNTALVLEFETFINSNLYGFGLNENSVKIALVAKDKMTSKVEHPFSTASFAITNSQPVVTLAFNRSTSPAFNISAIGEQKIISLRRDGTEHGAFDSTEPELHIRVTDPDFLAIGDRVSKYQYMLVKNQGSSNWVDFNLEDSIPVYDRIVAEKEGNYSLKIRVYDLYGSLSAEKSVTFTVVSVPPVISKVFGKGVDADTGDNYIVNNNDVFVLQNGITSMALNFSADLGNSKNIDEIHWQLDQGNPVVDVVYRKEGTYLGNAPSQSFDLNLGASNSKVFAITGYAFNPFGNVANRTIQVTVRKPLQPTVSVNNVPTVVNVYDEPNNLTFLPNITIDDQDKSSVLGEKITLKYKLYKKSNPGTFIEREMASSNIPKGTTNITALMNYSAINLGAGDFDTFFRTHKLGIYTLEFFATDKYGTTSNIVAGQNRFDITLEASTFTLPKLGLVIGDGIYASNKEGDPNASYDYIIADATAINWKTFVAESYNKLDTTTFKLILHRTGNTTEFNLNQTTNFTTTSSGMTISGTGNAIMTPETEFYAYEIYLQGQDIYGANIISEKMYVKTRKSVAPTISNFNLYKNTGTDENPVLVTTTTYNITNNESIIVGFDISDLDRETILGDNHSIKYKLRNQSNPNNYLSGTLRHLSSGIETPYVTRLTVNGKTYYKIMNINGVLGGSNQNDPEDPDDKDRYNFVVTNGIGNYELQISVKDRYGKTTLEPSGSYKSLAVTTDPQTVPAMDVYAIYTDENNIKQMCEVKEGVLILPQKAKNDGFKIRVKSKDGEYFNMDALDTSELKFQYDSAAAVVFNSSVHSYEANNGDILLSDIAIPQDPRRAFDAVIPVISSQTTTGSHTVTITAEDRFGGHYTSITIPITYEDYTANDIATSFISEAINADNHLYLDSDWSGFMDYNIIHNIPKPTKVYNYGIKEASWILEYYNLAYTQIGAQVIDKSRFKQVEDAQGNKLPQYVIDNENNVINVFQAILASSGKKLGTYRLTMNVTDSYGVTKQTQKTFEVKKNTIVMPVSYVNYTPANLIKFEGYTNALSQIYTGSSIFVSQQHADLNSVGIPIFIDLRKGTDGFSNDDLASQYTMLGRIKIEVQRDGVSLSTSYIEQSEFTAPGSKLISRTLNVPLTFGTQNISIIVSGDDVFSGEAGAGVTPRTMTVQINKPTLPTIGENHFVYNNSTAVNYGYTTNTVVIDENPNESVYTSPFKFQLTKPNGNTSTIKTAADIINNTTTVIPDNVTVAFSYHKPQFSVKNDFTPSISGIDHEIPVSKEYVKTSKVTQDATNDQQYVLTMTFNTRYDAINTVTRPFVVKSTPKNMVQIANTANNGFECLNALPFKHNASGYRVDILKDSEMGAGKQHGFRVSNIDSKIVDIASIKWQLNTNSPVASTATNPDITGQYYVVTKDFSAMGGNSTHDITLAAHDVYGQLITPYVHKLNILNPIKGTIAVALDGDPAAFTSSTTTYDAMHGSTGIIPKLTITQPYPVSLLDSNTVVPLYEIKSVQYKVYKGSNSIPVAQGSVTIPNEEKNIYATPGSSPETNNIVVGNRLQQVIGEIISTEGIGVYTIGFVVRDTFAEMSESQIVMDTTSSENRKTFTIDKTRLSFNSLAYDTNGYVKSGNSYISWLYTINANGITKTLPIKGQMYGDYNDVEIVAPLGIRRLTLSFNIENFAPSFIGSAKNAIWYLGGEQNKNIALPLNFSNGIDFGQLVQSDITLNVPDNHIVGSHTVEFGLIDIYNAPSSNKRSVTLNVRMPKEPIIADAKMYESFTSQSGVTDELSNSQGIYNINLFSASDYVYLNLAGSDDDLASYTGDALKVAVRVFDAANGNEDQGLNITTQEHEIHPSSINVAQKSFDVTLPLSIEFYRGVVMGENSQLNKMRKMVITVKDQYGCVSISKDIYFKLTAPVTEIMTPDIMLADSLRNNDEPASSSADVKQVSEQIGNVVIFNRAPYVIPSGKALAFKTVGINGQKPVVVVTKTALNNVDQNPNNKFIKSIVVTKNDSTQVANITSTSSHDGKMSDTLSMTAPGNASVKYMISGKTIFGTDLVPKTITYELITAERPTIATFDVDPAANVAEYKIHNTEYQFPIDQVFPTEINPETSYMTSGNESDLPLVLKLAPTNTAAVQGDYIQNISMVVQYTNAQGVTVDLIDESIYTIYTETKEVYIDAFNDTPSTNLDSVNNALYSSSGLRFKFNAPLVNFKRNYPGHPINQLRAHIMSLVNSDPNFNIDTAVFRVVYYITNRYGLITQVDRFIRPRSAGFTIDTPIYLATENEGVVNKKEVVSMKNSTGDSTSSPSVLPLDHRYLFANSAPSANVNFYAALANSVFNKDNLHSIRYKISLNDSSIQNFVTMDKQQINDMFVSTGWNDEYIIFPTPFELLLKNNTLYNTSSNSYGIRIEVEMKDVYGKINRLVKYLQGRVINTSGIDFYVEYRKMKVYTDDMGDYLGKVTEPKNEFSTGAPYDFKIETRELEFVNSDNSASLIPVTAYFATTPLYLSSLTHHGRAKADDQDGDRAWAWYRTVRMNVKNSYFEGHGITINRYAIVAGKYVKVYHAKNVDGTEQWKENAIVATWYSASPADWVGVVCDKGGKEWSKWSGVPVPRPRTLNSFQSAYLSLGSTINTAYEDINRSWFGIFGKSGSPWYNEQGIQVSNMSGFAYEIIATRGTDEVRFWLEKR